MPRIQFDNTAQIVYDYTMSLSIEVSTPFAVAMRLREQICSGEMGDGDAIPQDELATRLGVSKIPVREALRLLEGEGLVSFLPNRGVVVTGMSPDEAQEVTEMRVSLETAILCRAVPRFTAADERVARRLLEDLDDERNCGAQSALNWRFHAALYSPAARPRQLAAIQRLHVLLDRYMRLILTGLKHQKRSQQEHYDLLDACARHQMRRACDLLSAHVQFAGDLVVGHLRAVQLER